jgi:membrane protein implicated in regulation of membrane protease activity
MPGRSFCTFGKVLWALALLLLGANSAMAYVGPGADLAFVSYALTLLAWVLTAFSAVLLWPVYALLRKIRRGKNKSTQQTTVNQTVLVQVANDKPRQEEVHDDI